MLNSEKSPGAKSIKYTLLLSVMSCLLLVFSVSKASFGAKVFFEKKAAATSTIPIARSLFKLRENTLKKDADITKFVELTDQVPKLPGGKASLNKSSSGNTLPNNGKVDRLPMFPGGKEAFHKYLISAIRYPKDAKEKKLQGTVVTLFFIEKDGKLTDGKVLRDLGGGLGTEALRVLSASPAWIPALRGAKPVRISFVIPVVFSLDGKI